MALNWPAFHQDTSSAAYLFRPPSPPKLPSDLFAFHDNQFNHFSFISNHDHSSFNNNGATNLQFHDTIKYPTFSSSYNPHHQALTTPLPDLPQSSGYTHIYDQEQFFPMNPMTQLPPLPEVLPPWYDHGQFLPVAELAPEPAVLPEMYQAGGGCDAPLPPCSGYGVVNGIDMGEESCTVQVKKQIGGSLSAQSMAARVRRRKISEKTQELGKLIPGGHKMNTAAMFEAAFKYIKFLKAQVGVLKLMGCEEAMNSGELQALITSPSVQEKLYEMNNRVSLLLLRHDIEIKPGARPDHISGERNHRKVIAVADLDHKPIRIMEE